MDSKKRTAAQVVASFPPPTVGQALVTKRITEEMQHHGQLRIYDWLPNSSYGPVQKARKAALSLAAPVWILWNRLRGRRTFYSVANAGWGLYYNLLTLVMARLVGCRCILHHHAVSYLDRHHRCMQWIDGILREEDCHVVLGPEMKQMIQDTYGSQREIRILTNGFVVEDLCQASLQGSRSNSTPARPQSLGHLSNLCHSKGLGVVIDTFRALCRQFPDLTLVLAGPAFSPEAAETLRKAAQEFGDRLDYRGPVYAEDKTRFFEDIDVMLYPTRNDAQPLVILESLAHGTPTISTPVGCIPSLVNTPAWVTDHGEDFVDHAKALVREWMESPARYEEAVEHARSIAKDSCDESKRMLEEFCDSVFSRAA